MPPLDDDEPSVHDSVLLAYTVESAERQITFQTLYNQKERTDVVFSGVLAYHFEGDSLRTILFDIYEVSLEKLLAEHAALFERRRNYGWPVLVYGSPEELLQKLRLYDVKAFEVRSSYGLDGFVLAQDLTLKRCF